MHFKKILFLLLSLAVTAVVTVFSLTTRNVSLENSHQSGFQDMAQNLSPISGLSCQDYQRRPFAVILAGDEVARPLSGLEAADLVIEMPVMTDGMNRLMAIYVCGNPPEIGSIRSARHDFIPLALGFDAILAHWGGSHFALEKLNNNIMDNIDALKYSQSAFWRQKNLPAPHNGFTKIELLHAKAEELGYRLDNEFEGYPHRAPTPEANPPAQLIIGYPGIYRVVWQYDPASNDYLRWRGNKPEKDFNSQTQIRAKNIVIMFASSRHLESQYNDVDIEGQGKSQYYLDGEMIEGTWKKQGTYQKTKLYFYDQNGQEISFVPGQIWIEIIEPEKEVTYQITK